MGHAAANLSGLIFEFIMGRSNSVPVSAARRYAWLNSRRAKSELCEAVFLDVASSPVGVWSGCLVSPTGPGLRLHRHPLTSRSSCKLLCGCAAEPSIESKNGND